MVHKFQARHFSFLVLLLASLFINSCKKADSLVSNTKKEIITETAENFFKLPANVSPVIIKIAKELERQNKTKEFITAFIAREGFPIWDKSRIVRHKQKGNTANFDPEGLEDTTVYIPLVVSAENYVTGFLKATVNDSVDINIFRQSDYLNFPFKTPASSPNVTTAEEYAIRMMTMDRDVFGSTEFKIKDKRMFNNSTDYSDTANIQQYIVLNDSAGIGNVGNGFADGTTINNYQYEVCYTSNTYRYICGNNVNGSGNTSNTINCWELSGTITVCITYETEEGNPGGGGGSGGGNQGGGGGTWPFPPGGGNGGGGAPCTVEFGASVINSIVPIECNPSGGNPWPSRNEHGFLYGRIMELRDLFDLNELALLPCDSMALINLQTYGSMFQRIAQFSASSTVTNRLDSVRQAQGEWIVDNFNIQSLEEAYGPVVNCDYFPLRITQFPNNSTPGEFLEYFRLNINSFITSPITVQFSSVFGPQFDDNIKWSQSSGNALGALNHVYIPGNSGSVILSDYQHINTSIEQHYFKLSTLETPFDYEHPVAGHREFGLFNTLDSLSRYTFYTMGVDRTWDWSTERMNQMFNGFAHADSLWTNVQKNLKDFINNNGGVASYYAQPRYIARPKWSDVKDFLKGTIDMVTLKQRLGC